MKLSYLLGYTVAAVWWLIVVCAQLCVPLMLWLGFAVNSLYLLAAAGMFFACGLITAVSGGLNTVPSILWRCQNTLQTRIIEVEGMYALQMKVLGLWIYVETSEGELSTVMTAWYPDISVYPFLVSKRKQAENYLLQLQMDIAEGVSASQHYPEVLNTQVITRGNIIKPK